MKKCAHCGCYNSDNRVICADCGQVLAKAEEISETEFESKLEKLSRYSDPFSFKPRHQVVFYASLIFIVANIVLFNLSLIHPDIVFISVLCFILCIFPARFSETIWKIQKFFLQFKVSGDIEPSDWWFISREIEIFGFFGLGVIMFLFGITGNTFL